VVSIKKEKKTIILTHKLNVVEWSCANFNTNNNRLKYDNRPCNLGPF